MQWLDFTILKKGWSSSRFNLFILFFWMALLLRRWTPNGSTIFLSQNHQTIYLQFQLLYNRIGSSGPGDYSDFLIVGPVIQGHGFTWSKQTAHSCVGVCKERGVLIYGDSHNSSRDFNDVFVCCVCGAQSFWVKGICHTVKSLPDPRLTLVHLHID